ncbi:MAG: hypothetical protein DME25_02650, partial [Verrucomicrobia bacterium]
MALICAFTEAAETKTAFSGGKKLNNLVSDLLEVAPVANPNKPLTFSRSTDGWVFISATCKGKGTVRVMLDKELGGESAIVHCTEFGPRGEAMRFVAKGKHTIQVEREGNIAVEKLVVKAIPELIHCGLGFNSQIKSYGLYDLEFLRADILPNITTLIVPGSIQLAQSAIEDWHRQGKRFVAEAGVNSQAKTAEDHVKYWTGFFDRAPFLDGIIINEFIVNKPVAEWATLTPERLARMEQERKEHEVYGAAFKKMRAEERYTNKMVYAYVGGSGKKLNQEIIGTNFIRTILDCRHRVAL